MLVEDYCTQKSVSIDESTLRVEVRQCDPGFVALNGGPEYCYFVYAHAMNDYSCIHFINAFDFPVDAFAYIDYLKGSSAEVPHDVGDQPGGDPDANI